MNIFKNYIRNKIADLIEWAIGEQLSRLRNDIHSNYNRFLTLQREQEKLRKTIHQATDVAVDHHLRENKSWAVICFHGKKGRNIVKFYQLHDNHVDALREIIKDFGTEGTMIDTNPFICKGLY